MIQRADNVKTNLICILLRSATQHMCIICVICHVRVLFNIIQFMSLFILNLINERLSYYSETEKPNKKVALESAETIVENNQNSDSNPKKSNRLE